MPVWNDGNKIGIRGEFSLDDSYRVIAAMHSISHNRGYKDLTIDFSFCEKAFSPQMMVICSRCLYYQESGIDIELALPNEEAMRRLFLNTNWAHLIDSRNFEPSRYRGFTHAPAIRFTDGVEQTKAVDRILDILLAAISHFRRDEIRYIEWAINEITDNVMNHAQSKVGGIVQITNFRQRERIEVVVADSGVGIPSTLRQGHLNIHSDTEALHAAIREGVTRDKNIGQGNGLYGTWRICQKTEGEFYIHSGHASLSSPRPGEVSSVQKNIPINGTIVVGKIGYSDRFDLSEALVFAGKTHVPVDYIETHFEADESGNVVFTLKTESEGFGSRVAGNPVRRKLINIINLIDKGKLIVDLSDIILVSSSYADEVFGKLFLELGPIEFMRKVEFRNVDQLVKNLIDRAIMQRMVA
ncbi:MAG: DUF4325 domain-containing protein [Mesorhizobium sp.]|uniref:ATP-binding protein n=1 Tax=Mesorhizobium sp. TaxID=1871066 RepID=UPI00120031C2|nr:DUF4325 domain-containing protein [Mesorhizobium sp.]TIV81753.1 MAG: DUF4325 domain-containing protein [Mesorhizobium sp.]TIW10861.1 MAG: DUF4325 domain-containing protein [Mesorhizobium sp.]